jgi:hypothetical protein
VSVSLKLSISKFKAEKSMKLQKLQVGTILLLSICLQTRPCQAVSLGIYNFDSQSLNASNTDPNVQFSTWQIVNLSNVLYPNAYINQGLSSGPWVDNQPKPQPDPPVAPDPNNSNSLRSYWQFSLTPQNNKTLLFDSISLYLNGNGAGADPDRIAVAARTGTNSFTIVQDITNPNGNGNNYIPVTLDLTSSFLHTTGGSDQIDFRLFGYGNDTNGGKIIVDEVSVNGTAVPFGFSPSLGIVALGILFGSRKLFKRVKNIGTKAILSR